jgi:predicted metal-dependent enzyme (double-stranded beta helix superfamily)
MNLPGATVIRVSAQDIHAAIARHRGDLTKLGPAMRHALAPVIAHPDLMSLGAPRQGNNVAVSKYLYFDGELAILIYEIPLDRPVPPHDHGIWETVSVYRGRMRHRVHRRSDDRAVPGRATLATIDDRELIAGDFAIVAPPDDIHSFAALDNGTIGITIVFGSYKNERNYYDIEKGIYEVRRQRNAR